MIFGGNDLLIVEIIYTKFYEKLINLVLVGMKT